MMASLEAVHAMDRFNASSFPEKAAVEKDHFMLAMSVHDDQWKVKYTLDLQCHVKTRAWTRSCYLSSRLRDTLLFGLSCKSCSNNFAITTKKALLSLQDVEKPTFAGMCVFHSIYNLSVLVPVQLWLDKFTQEKCQVTFSFFVWAHLRISW